MPFIVQGTDSNNNMDKINDEDTLITDETCDMHAYCLPLIDSFIHFSVCSVIK